MGDFQPSDLCGCCEALSPATPLRISNRPALSAIAYRIGTFASFREAMLQAIASEPRLASLTTRESDDYGITLLELWAVIGDVLTFYQERIANESFLRTAVHRDSVLRMARMLDYRLRPGLAAETRLAFTLEKDAKVKIPVGFKVMTVPGQDELPQFFETIEAIEADARLNKLRVFPPTTAATPFAAGSPGGPLTNYPTPVVPGDKLVLWSDKVLEEKVVDSLKISDDAARITWSPKLTVELGQKGHAAKYTRMLRFFGYNAPGDYVRYEPGVRDIQTGQWTTPPGWVSESLTTNLAFDDACIEYPLDARYEDLKPGTPLLIETDPGVFKKLTVKSVRQAAQSLGPMQDTVTLMRLDDKLGKITDRRACRVYQLVEPELAFRNYDFPAQISGGRVVVPLNWLDKIDPRRVIMLRDANTGPFVATVTQATPTSAEQFLQIDFNPALPQPLETASAELLGNIAKATHGEAVIDEILGDGDAAKKFQTFALQKSPLTYLASKKSARGQSTLRVLVNGQQWSEVDNLYGQKPSASVYTLRELDEGKTTVQFGDGVTGAGLPSGRANLKASYRKGLGLQGRARADQLSILLQRPVGLKAVSNPLAAEGGVDPETLDQARTAAPTTVKTFDRAISLTDFESLVTASGEIAKATATWVWRGLEKAIHLTVAAQRGAYLSSDALKRLHAGLTIQRDPNYALLVGNLCRVPLTVRARLTVKPNFVRDDVLKTARTALSAHLGFDKVAFAVAIHRSEIYAVLQHVTGVLSVDLDTLHYKGYAGWTDAQLATRGATAAPLQPHVRLFAARPTTPKLLADDPIVASCLANLPTPDILPAEQAYIADERADIQLSAAGGVD